MLTLLCTGSCANNSSPTDGKSFIAEKCVYNTAAETADFTRAASSAGVSCSCDPGFTLTGTAPRSCAGRSCESVLGEITLCCAV